MKKQKNAKVGNKKSFFRRIVFILLFIFLLPVMLIGYFIKLLFKNNDKKVIKRSLQGKELLLNSTIEDVDKMSNLELEYYFKKLFFYDGYYILEIDYKKDNLFFVSRYNIDYVVVFKKVNKELSSRNLIKLLKIIYSQKNSQAIIVTNGMVSQTLKDNLSSKIIVKDRNDLIEMISLVKTKLELTTKKEDLIDKFDKSILDKFPHMI